MEEVVRSNTSGCTVQRTCVDESLTGKCVEYHNDQWFEFTPETSGDYFINISNQACRDVRGVQLVVFTGKPCEPKTYNAISCTSLATQDDLFVPLKALQAKQTYLLNVDGYLNDQCQFRISVSRAPKGLPASTEPFITTKTFNQSRKVTLKWLLPDSLSVTEFRVLRREATQFKTEEIGKVAVIRDSYGKILREYTFQDSLFQPGNYLYQIVAYGTTDDVPVMQQQEWRTLRNAANSPIRYRLPLEKYPNKAELLITITDAASGNLLYNSRIVKRANQQAEILVNNWVAEGIKKIRVEIQQRRKGKTISASTHLVSLENLSLF